MSSSVPQAELIAPPNPAIVTARFRPWRAATA